MGSRSDAGGASGGLGVSFVSALGAGNASGDDDDGVATPEGFQNTPDQWHSAAAQKKRGVSDTLAGAATQRDSQATQIATEVQSFDAQAMRADGGGPAWAQGPSFVNATGSLSGSVDGSGTDRRLDDVDEDETQIIMSLSQEPGALRKSARHIEEEELEAVPSLPQLSHEDAALATGEASDADSEMSDDMLEQDGDVNGLSSIAKSFQLSEADLLQEKKPAGNVYKPRMPFQITPPASLKGDGSVGDDESSGAETEVDEEPQIATEAFGTSKTDVGEMPSVKKGKRSVSNVAMSQPEEKRPRRSGVLERSASCSDVGATPERTKRARISLAKPVDGKPPRPRAKRLHLDSGQDASLSHKDSAAKKYTESRSTSSSQETDTGTEASIEDTAVLDDQYSEAIAAPTTPSKNPITSVSEDAASQESSTVTASRTTPKPGRKRKVSKEADEEGAQEATGASEPALHVPAATLSAGPSIRVMFTGLDGTIPKLRDKVKRIADACQEDDDIEIVTHLVAPKNQLKRTVKLLCGISLCDHILDERWLDESARTGVPASETLHCLKDTTAEAKWHFSLYRTMYTVPKVQRRKLFDGLHFFITNHKSILPPVKDLVRIVECAGGHADMKGAATPDDIVITSEAALPLAATKKAMANAAPDRIYSPEFILSSILQQRIDYDVNRLSPVEASESSSKKKRGRK